jgi:hypothetical protein
LKLRTLALALFVPLALAACGAEPVWAPDAEVTRARYVTGGTPSVTLYTVVNKRSGEGGHSALMVDASQRVLFDPAGTFRIASAPERNDVIFGVNETIRKIYIDYHARETFDVLEQTVHVSPAVAEELLRDVETYGAVNKAFCGNSISHVLRRTPGFSSIPQTFFPMKISRAFGALPGATTVIYKDGDPAISTGVRMLKGDNAEP